MGMKEIGTLLKTDELCCEDFQTLTEMLWYFYTQYDPIEPETIREEAEGLEPIMKSLSQKRKRKMIRSVMNLCIEHERVSFARGVQVGAKLVMELLDEEAEQLR